MVMSGREGESDSETPVQRNSLPDRQGIEQDEEITTVQNENGARVVREGKERRRRWVQKLTPRPSRDEESIEDVEEVEAKQESHDIKGMLPDEIVKLLAAHEEYVIFPFASLY